MFYGIVENNNDSSHVDGKKLGRCQVRVFGIHTNIKSPNGDNYIKVEDLPWFDVLMPVTSAGQQLNYDTPFVKNGSIVVVEYMDEYQQIGVITGVLLRQPETMPDFVTGFTDPDQKYPSNDDLHKSPLYPYATGEINDVVENKQNNLETSTLGFTEPATSYSPEYGKNKVISTKNHIIELDETEGSERIHIYHKSGSFIEYHPDGSIVEKVKLDKYSLVVADSNTKINGKYNIEIVGDINIKTGSNANIEASSKCTITSPITTLTGGQVIIEGAVAPTSNGGFTCLNACVFSGAVHNGHVLANT